MRSVRLVTDTFFTVEPPADGSEWFVPDRPRPRAVGPRRLPRRAADRAARAGPRAGAARRMRLARISRRPRPPGADGRLRASTPRSSGPGGRRQHRAAIVDADGKVRATATGMHVAVSPTPLFAGALDNSGDRHAAPGRRRSPASSRSAASATAGPGFRDARRVRYPPGEDNGLGADDGVDAHASRCCPTRSCRRSSGSARWPTAATPSAATPSPTRCSSSTPIS